MCLYQSLKHRGLYPVDIYQSVTNPLMSKIPGIPLNLSQITVAQAMFFINHDFCLQNMSKILNIEQNLIKLLLEIKFTCLCIVLTIYHTLASV